MPPVVAGVLILYTPFETLLYPVNDRDHTEAGSNRCDLTFQNHQTSETCSKALMNPFRGILMIIAAAFAFWRGWQIHSGRYAWMAYGLAVVASPWPPGISSARTAADSGRPQHRPQA